MVVLGVICIFVGCWVRPIWLSVCCIILGVLLGVNDPNT